MAGPAPIVPKPGLGKQLKLVWELMKDNRVPLMLKLLPVGAAIYLVVPADFMPLNPIDDAFVIWAGFNLFIELAPDTVVKEITDR